MALETYLRQQRGRLSAVARAIGVNHATVIRWARHQVPAEHLAAVSRVTGIPAAELRPDLAAAFAADMVASSQDNGPALERRAELATLEGEQHDDTDA